MDTRIKITKITPEEADAFRERVRRQNAAIAKLVVIPIDDFLAIVDPGSRNEEYHEGSSDGATEPARG